MILRQLNEVNPIAIGSAQVVPIDLETIGFKSANEKDLRFSLGLNLSLSQRDAFGITLFLNKELINQPTNELFTLQV